MDKNFDETVRRIAQETNHTQPEGCGSSDEWTIEFARRLLVEWRRDSEKRNDDAINEHK